jgi:flagellar motor switch/type III secretory pathway protein FliN
MNLPELIARCPEQGLVTRICFSHNGVITMEESNQIEPKAESVLVQLNLGNIELSLRELVALRSGSRIEIDTQMPIQCALRIGATTLATGEIDRMDDKVSVRITEIF